MLSAAGGWVWLWSFLLQPPRARTRTKLSTSADIRERIGFPFDFGSAGPNDLQPATVRTSMRAGQRSRRKAHKPRTADEEGCTAKTAKLYSFGAPIFSVS